MKPLSEFCCINQECSEYGKRGGINLRVHQTYGKSDPIRLLECKVCGIMFSEIIQHCLDAVFPKTRSYLSCITWPKAVDNDGFADWWV